MIKTTFNSKYLKIFFLIFLLPFFSTLTYSQCAGNDNSITICAKETYNQGIGNPNGVVNLYTLLGGVPTPGGTWIDLNSSGGLNTATGILNTWQINQGGVYNYRYTVTGVPGCVDNISIITLTLGGFPGVDNPNANACGDDTSVPLFSFLGSNPNPHFNGTWSGGPPGSVSGSNFNAQLAGVGTFVLTYTVPAVGICPSRSANVTVEVHPTPNAGTSTPLVFCETDDFSALTNVDLFDQLTGEDSGGFWTDTNATGELSGPGDSFINIQNIATNFGPGTYNFLYTINPSHPICAPSSTNVSITIEAVVDLNGATLAVAPDICFSEITTTPIIGTITQGINPIPNGTYDITYVLTGANSGTATVTVTFTGGVASYTINPAFLTAVGTTTVEITTVIDTNTTLDCTRSISNLTDTFIINENPNITDSNLTIADICLGQNGQGQISDINGPTIQLSDGTYTVTFNITGPNGTVNGQTATVTITGGNGAFSVLSALTPVIGNYTVTVTNIRNNATNCSSAANISDSFEVSPIPDAQTIAVSIDDICDGENVIVNISGATGLTNGLYDITYDITGAITVSNQTASNVVFNAGIGTFTLPVGILNIGNSTLTITNLSSTTTTCDTTTFTNPSDAFQIHAIPDAGDINITVADVCFGQSGTVNILDSNIGVAPELTNGSYTITYDLTGANIASGQNVTATITNGTGSFTIPASQLTNLGATNISILFITNTTSGCDAVGGPITTSFDVLENPIIDNVSLAVTQPICEGQGTTATITGATINDGNYDLVYNITGANTVTGQTVSVVFASGNTTFSIPTGQIPNVGNYTILITNIVNNNTPNACTSPVTNVTTTFTVSENPDTTNTTITALDPVCLGSNGQITLTDLTGTLSNGNYNILYNLSGVNIANNVVANVTIAAGTGSFSIPGASLTNMGTTTITITSIANSVTNCTSPANLTVSFEVIPLPDTTGATLTVTEPICLGGTATAQINGPLLTNGSYTLTYDLSGANTSTGNASTVTITAANGTFTIPSTLLTNTGTTTITLTLLTNTTTGCVVQGGALSDSFIVSPIPVIVASEVTIPDICIGNSAVVSINAPVGLIDGNYSLNYSISGVNGPSNQTVNFTVTGGVASFTIASALLTNAGLTTISFTSITNLDTTCSAPLSFSVNFMVNPLPDINPTQFTIADICLGQNGSGVISGATNLANGDYTIIYNLTGTNIANNQTATFTIAAGGGTFVIPSGILTNIGSTTVTIVSITNNTTGCTTTPIVITDTFFINPLPDTTGTTVTVTEPICLGGNATAQINGPLLTDGSYTLTYDLSGANTSTGNAATVTITAANGTFTIPSALLSNAGTTTITLTLQTNTTTGCVVQGGALSDSFIVSPIPVIVASEVTIPDICIGNSAVVSINAPVGLIDGNYSLNYSISGVNGPSNQTVNFTVTGGVASFTIASALLTNAGLTTISFTSITNLDTTCSAPLSFSVNFMINPLPDINPTQFTIADICLGQNGSGTISGATNLVNGDYTIIYNLTGTNIANNQSATITIAAGGGTFVIPSGILTNIGSTTVTIVSITNNTTGCTTTPIVITDTFFINPLPDTTGTTVTVTEPICLGGNATAQINGPLLTDGSYTLTYDLSGANTSTGNAATVTITAANGTFTIPSALLSNAGTTTITLTLQTNTTTGCVVQGGSVSDSFIVSPIPVITVTEVTIPDICIGNSAAVSINAPVGLIDGNYSLNYSISGVNGPSNQTVNFTVTGGVASFTIASALLTNAGLTTISFTSITNLDTTCSSVLSFSVNFMVNPLPNVNPNQFTIADTCLGQNGTGAISGATNLVDSNYTITYNLTGTNIANNQTATITIAAGAGTFVIPSALLTNTGLTDLTIVSITNNITGCTTSPIVITDTFFINPLPDTTGTTVTVAEPICLGSGTTATINSPLLADGIYNITYDVTGLTTISGSATITLVGGISTPPFIIQSSELPNAGNYTITITAIIDPVTICAGTSAIITDTFVVNPIPVLLVSEALIADICIGSDATVSITSLGGLIDGNYDFTYSLSGANATTQTVSVVISGGIGSITIPAALLPNVGATSLTVDTIVNTDTTCSNTSPNVQVDFNVNPLPVINAGEMSVADVCLGQDAVGTILNALNLIDGTYSITFDLSGTNSATAQTTTLAINSGGGIFNIPAAFLTNPGLTTIMITAVTNTTTGCSTSGLSVTDTFDVIPLPDVTGALITIADICITSDAGVTITNATALADGDYTLFYDLSGANTSTNNSVLLQFNSGVANFIIPAAQLSNGGATTLTVQDLIYDLTLCGANTLTMNPVTFDVNNPQAPTLETDGNLFCIQDSPTIADLTSNVTGSGTITWYNSPSGGTAYNATDLLTQGTIYYATLTQDITNCVSSVRLAVTVDLTACDDLFIPDGFSPNDDYTNDEFYIKNLEDLYPQFRLEIFNRYGNMVYTGNINTPNFNGKSNQSTVGKEVLPTGVYFYVLYYNDANGTKPKQGRLYLSR